MRRLARALPVLCTLLLLGLGASMPRLASLALDRRLEREITRLDDPTVSLELAQGPDFFQALALARTQSTVIQLTEGRRMTQEEAIDAALGLLQALALDGGGYTIDQAMPVLLSSRDVPGLTGVFWQCMWSDGKGQGGVVLLDDQSGLAVSFTLPVRAATVSYVSGGFAEAAMDAAEYCRLHFPVSTVKLAAAGDGTNYTLTLYREEALEGLDASAAIQMYLYDGWLNFNY